MENKHFEAWSQQFESELLADRPQLSAEQVREAANKAGVIISKGFALALVEVVNRLLTGEAEKGK